MKRHYFISDKLSELEAVERELEAEGITRPQIHVLSNSDAELEQYEIQPVHELMRTDMVNSSLWGFGIGLIGALLVIGTTIFMGWAEAIGWSPFVFLAIIILGFCTWEGGFLGFQEKNRRFKRFESAISNNRHVLLVDVDEDQLDVLNAVIKRHPQLAPAGEGEPTPGWVIVGEQQLREFIRWGP